MRAAYPVDLHLHTTFSDGSLSPEELVEVAIARGMRVIAITDHDSTAGLARAQAAAAKDGMLVVPAIEMSSAYQGHEVHLLGYGLDQACLQFQQRLARFQRDRKQRNDEILERLRKLGCPLIPEQVISMAHGGSIARPHIASALVAAGYVQTRQEAFSRFLADGKPAYVPRTRPTTEEAIAALREAGALVSLAHPAKLNHSISIPHLAALGLQALEVYHTDHLPADNTNFGKRAKALGLLETGGSDSHGPNSDRPVDIGSVALPEQLWDALRPRLKLA